MTDPDNAESLDSGVGPPRSRRRRLLRDGGAALAVLLGAGCLSNPWEPGGSTPAAGEGRTPATGGTAGQTTTGAGDDRTTTTGGTAAPETTESAGDGSGDPTATATSTPTATATPTPVPPEGREPDQVVEVSPDQRFRFVPEHFEIEAGSTVHWVWKDGGHNVRPRSKPGGSDWTGTPGGDSDTFGEGYLHAHTFEVAGEYEYYCAPHQSLGLEGTFRIL